MSVLRFNNFPYIPLMIILLLCSCGFAATEPTPTPTSVTSTPSPTITITQANTLTTTPTQFLPYLLGSPFGDCGDGVATIWSNDSYNGLVPEVYNSKMDQHHGHVDITRPYGCTSISVYAPADGFLVKVGTNNYDLTIDDGLILGLNPDNPPELAKIHDNFIQGSVVLKMAHFSATIPDGHVTKGDEIGKLVMEASQWKMAYQITTSWGGYKIWSPTLFLWDKQPVCVIGSPYDCIPELNDFPP